MLAKRERERESERAMKHSQVEQLKAQMKLKREDETSEGKLEMCPSCLRENHLAHLIHEVL